MHPSWSRQIAWLPPAQQHRFTDGPKADGKVYVLPQWNRWSDKRKLRALRAMAKEYGMDPRIRDFTIRHVVGQRVDQRDYRGQAAAILLWVQNNVMYYNEPGEQLQAPWYTLRVRHGDCDDMAILVATMAESIRLPWRFVLAGQARGKPVRVAEGHRAPFGFCASHIYVDLGWPPFSEGKYRRDKNGRAVPATTWAAAEPTIKGVPLGYDVVRHGLPRGLMPELSGLGDATAEPEAPGATSWVASIPWRLLVIGTIQGVASGLVLRWLLAAASSKRIVL